MILTNILSTKPHFAKATTIYGLYVVTDAGAPGGHFAMARAALIGGARIVQLRDKVATGAQLLREAQHLRELTLSHNALLIINDRIDVALACGADGVHLGPDDLPLETARKLMPFQIIGASCGTLEEARRAQQLSANYIGVGAVFGTQTKHDAGAPIGLETLRAIVQETSLPVAAIGGIMRENIAEVVRCGASMACVISAISRANDEIEMEQRTRDLVNAAFFR